MLHVLTTRKDGLKSSSVEKNNFLVAYWLLCIGKDSRLHFVKGGRGTVMND